MTDENIFMTLLEQAQQIVHSSTHPRTALGWNAYDHLDIVQERGQIIAYGDFKTFSGNIQDYSWDDAHDAEFIFADNTMRDIAGELTKIGVICIQKDAPPLDD